MAITLSRSELYLLTWKEPLTELAKRFRISRHELENLCKQTQIPLPKAGHWMKVKYGKIISQPELPIDEPSFTADKTVIIQAPEKKIKTKEIKEKILPELKIQKRLSKPVDLVLETQKNLAEKQRRGYLHNGLIVNSPGLDIKVAPENVSRALRFWDTLIKSLESRSHTVSIKGHDTISMVKDTEFKMFLRECTNRELVKKREHWSEYSYHPNGVFAFRVVPLYKEWKDSKISIENKLPEIIASLEFEADERIERHQHWEKERLLRLEKERVQEENIKNREKELGKFINLLNQSERWNKVTILRKYLQEIEFSETKNSSLTDSLTEWLAWAKNKIDWFDPLIEREDEILGKFNMKTFNDESTN